MELHKIPTTLLGLIFLVAVPVHCGIYKSMAEAMIHHMMSSWSGGGGGWESKGVTFGLKSKGMTAIIPVPFPIPVFTKDKGGGGDSGGGGGGKVKYVPVP